LSHPSEKYESQLGLLFPIYGKIKNVPNHQLAIVNGVYKPIYNWGTTLWAIPSTT
jgi:hypothetical protein